MAQLGRGASNALTKIDITDAGFLTGKKIKQWIFYRRDEKAITAFKALMRTEI